MKLGAAFFVRFQFGFVGIRIQLEQSSKRFQEIRRQPVQKGESTIILAQKRAGIIRGSKEDEMSTETRKTRVALYARVSTSNHGQDFGLQLDELRAVAVQRGWMVVGEYIDDGISGNKESRPALDEMMKAARAGRVDAVAVWRFDRFARSTTHLLQGLEEFRQLGVNFISLRESLDTGTPVGKMIFTMVAAIAEFERALIRERGQAGVTRARAAGKHCGRPKNDVDVRPIVALLEKGHSLTQISKMLGQPKTTIRRRLLESRAAGQ